VPPAWGGRLVPKLGKRGIETRRSKATQKPKKSRRKREYSGRDLMNRGLFDAKKKKVGDLVK